MKIAIASGKGGTGKTTVAVNLYYFLSKEFNNQVRLIDCDVEEPNDMLFFHGAELNESRDVFTPVPKIDTTKCTFCKKCSEWCEFNAISIVKALKFAEVNNDLCHSCGACSMTCAFDAITEHPQPLGNISSYDPGFGAGVVEGRLEIGSALQTKLIKEVKKSVNTSDEVLLFDAPPGTSCPVVETVSDADYIVLVTEPTPFGLHDLKLTVDLVRELGIPFGVLVNKTGAGNNDVFDYLTEHHIDILGTIPYSKNYASTYSKGELLDDINNEFSQHYQHVVQKVIQMYKN
ncbi:ATP-binding protein [Maribellus mangrovi]|uniref:ATP-binding protein n=1 Tax=Maribellus mangrovi TaxID=3133146 RepID=UPI0030EB2CA8